VGIWRNCTHCYTINGAITIGEACNAYFLALKLFAMNTTAIPRTSLLTLSPSLIAYSTHIYKHSVVSLQPVTQQNRHPRPTQLNMPSYRDKPAHQPIIQQVEVTRPTTSSLPRLS
jgi:hypothetical protein